MSEYNEIETDDNIASHTRPLRKKVNYAEIEHSYDFVDEDEENIEENIEENNTNFKASNSKNDEYLKDEPQEEEEEHINTERRSSRISAANAKNQVENAAEEHDSPSRSTRSTRSRNRVPTYNEDSEDEEYKENEADGADEFYADENLGQDDDDDDFDDYSGKRKRNSRGKTRRTRNHGYTTSSRSNINDFIEQDEDDDDYGYGRPNKRVTRSTRSHTASLPVKKNTRTTRRRSRRVAHDDDDEGEDDFDGDNADEDLDLQQELHDLQNDSPVQSPKRFLRERKKNVNYVLPLPTDLDNNLDDYSAAANANGANTGNYNDLSSMSTKAASSNSILSPKRGTYSQTKRTTGPVRRLFATGGPFGGNDVTSIFGGVTVPSYLPSFNNKSYLTADKETTTDVSEPTNSNELNTKIIGTSIDLNHQQQPPPTQSFSNVPNLASSSSNNKKNTLILDSDSSDDEILPFGETSESYKKSSTGGNNKKPETADVDPLGVDMNIDFSDVGGLDNYIDQLKEMVALPLLYPELYSNFDITPPRGVLFHGPPGTGKTLMARALAASCSKASGKKITFFMRKGADILSKWVGEAERQLRLLFEEAKKNQPSIIFFDEIDGLAPVRSSKQEQIHASIVSTMLALMDGMDNRGQVIVIGATNRPDSVDPALRRPGRFDREFYFPLPDVKGRSKIIQIHTKKWNPPLPEKMIEKIAELTKGYGGADLRSLCTEAALNSIQRKYPQIYQSSTKYKIDPSKVHVSAKDFMLALEKIVPSSTRGGSSLQQPLPKNIKCLLDAQLKTLEYELEFVLPKDSIQKKHSDSLIKHYIEYDEVDSDEDSMGLDELNNVDGGFGKQEFLKELKDSRVTKPRFLLCGKRGNGQQYIGSALLNYLEGINIQNLDLSVIMNETTKTMEACVVQAFTEARRRQPAVIYIPNFEVWIRTVAPTVVYTLTSLLRSLRTEEKVMLMAITDGELPTEPPLIASLIAEFDFETAFELRTPDYDQRYQFFEELKTFVQTKPTKFESSRKRSKPMKKLEEQAKPADLEVDENGSPLTEDQKLHKTLKKYLHQDMKLKNTLKIKLSGLMELIKNRYRKFRKPPIDDIYLAHLFEPLPGPSEYYQPAYVKDGDRILEVATGKRFFNMDLDTIEERLWNGFYCEPKQFLKDIEMIYLDANVLGDREKIIRSSEMFANAQVGVEDIAVPEFAEQCRATRKRDNLRLKLYLKQKQMEEEQLDNQEVPVAATFSENTEIPVDSTVPSGTLVEVSTGAGSQVQAQLLVVPGENQVSEVTATETLIVTEEPNVGEVDAAADSALGSDVQHVEESLNSSQVPEDTSDDVVTKTGENEKDQVPEPELIVDQEKLDDCIKKLADHTNDWPVQKIQQKYSKILSAIWKCRYSWDRTEAIDIMHELVEQ